jgi:hypothetical protein
MVGAIAGAYGPVKDAYERHVAIVRGSLAHPEVTIVDYRDVKRGKIPDIALKPRDIVYVPWSPYRYIEKYIDTILNTFVSSVAINGGSWLVLKQPQQGGVFIPVGSRVTVLPPLPPVQ